MDNQLIYDNPQDEIFKQLKRNADLYIQPQDQNNNNQQQQLMIPVINITPKTSSLREIKLVDSLLESGDGQNQSVKLICKNCKKQIQTKLHRRVGKGTYLVSCILFVCSFGILCLACLPCYMDDCKDIIHKCPNCHHSNGSTPYQFFE